MSSPLTLPSIAQITDPATRATFLSLLSALNLSGATSGGGGTVTNTGTLTANQLVIGNGGVDISALGSLGTTTTLLHGNAAGAPTWSAVDLAADVTGVLPAASVSAPGATTQVVFNDTGALAGDAGFTFNDSTKSITLGGDVAGAVSLGISNSNAAADSTAHMSFVETSSSGGGFVFRAWSAATATIGNLAEMSSTSIGTGIGTMGLAIYTQNSRTLGFGTVGQTTDLVIDTSHNTTVSGSLTVGTLDTAVGVLALAGAATLSSSGGYIRLHTAADYDTTYDYYHIDVLEDDLRIGRAGAADIVLASTGAVSIAGALTVTTNITDSALTAGRVVLAGTAGLLDDDAGLLFNTTTKTLTLGGSTSGSVGLKGAAVAGSTTYTLPSADGTKGYGFTTDGSAVLSWQDVGGINVKVYGATGDGSTDDAAAINACLVAGDAYFPPGTYLCKTTILIPSSRKVFGSGAASIIKFNNTFVGTAVAWQVAAGNVYLGFANSNYVASGANSHIEIHSLKFLTTSTVTGTAGFHCIHMRNTTDWKVHHCSFDGGNGAGDAVSGTLGVDFQITNNYATGFANCCYDVWDAPTYGVIASNTAHTYTGGAGIFVNGMTTLGGTAHGHNVAVTGNIVIAGGGASSGQGIYIAGLPGGSTVKYCSVTGNTVATNGSNTFVTGIDVREGNYVAVVGNVISGAHTTASLFVDSNYNTLTGNNISGAVLGLSVQGDYNIFSGNVLQGNTTDISDTGTGNFDTTNSSANALNIVQ